MNERFAQAGDAADIRALVIAAKPQLDAMWAAYGGLADLTLADVQAYIQRPDTRTVIGFNAQAQLRSLILGSWNSPIANIAVWISIPALYSGGLAFIASRLPPNAVVQGHLVSGATDALDYINGPAWNGARDAVRDLDGRRPLRGRDRTIQDDGRILSRDYAGYLAGVA